MDSPKVDVDSSRLAHTPAKAAHEEYEYASSQKKATNDSSTTLLRSPDQITLARKTPPTLSIKRRKGTSLFGSHDYSRSKGLISGASTVYKKQPGASSIGSKSGSNFLGDEKEDPVVGREASETTSLDLLVLPGIAASTTNAGATAAAESPVSSGCCFASPLRPPREEQLSCAGADRFTPQRNLGGLFASPLPPARGDLSPARAQLSDPTTPSRPPRKLQSPGRQSGEWCTRPSQFVVEMKPPLRLWSFLGMSFLYSTTVVGCSIELFSLRYKYFAGCVSYPAKPVLRSTSKYFVTDEVLLGVAMHDLCAVYECNSRL